MPINRVLIVVPAFNEEKTLSKCLSSIHSAIDYTSSAYDPEIKADIIISVNGSSDHTLEVAQSIAKSSKENIRVIHSEERGMVKAEQKSLDLFCEDHPNSRILFLDADSIIRKDALSIILQQYKKHPELKMVGAHPIPITPKGNTLHEMLLHQMLNFRAYFPKSQLAVKDVSKYHPYAFSDPQPVGPEFEVQSKIMIHGRCFSIRNPSVWDVPSDAIGEDLWLNLSVNQRFGPGSSRMMYNANVDFWPIDDFEHYIKVYARIHKDLEKTVKEHPEFSLIAKDEETFMSDRFLSLNPTQKVAFEMYKTLERTTSEQFGQGIFSASNIEDLWNYDSKKVVE